MHLGIQWQEHELGTYPMIVLTWEDAMRGAPSEYIERCERALTAYEYGEELPRWSLPALDIDSTMAVSRETPGVGATISKRKALPFRGRKVTLQAAKESAGRRRGKPLLSCGGRQQLPLRSLWREVRARLASEQSG